MRHAWCERLALHVAVELQPAPDIEIDMSLEPASEAEPVSCHSRPKVAAGDRVVEIQARRDLEFVNRVIGRFQKITSKAQSCARSYSSKSS